MKEPTRRPGEPGRRLRDAPSTTGVSADLILRLDEHGVVLAAEGGGPDMPWTPADLLGRALAAVLPPAAAREVLEALARLPEGGGALSVQFALPAGFAVSHLEVRLAPGEGNTLAVVRDIGASRQELIDLLAQRTFLRQVFDLVPNMVFAKDREGRFTLANRAVAAIYGATPSQLIGKTDAAFNPDRDEVEHFRKDDIEVMDALRPKLIPEEPVSSPEGGTRWFQTIKIPIVSPDGRADAVLGVSTDITARKEAEERLALRGERLVRHQAALRSLALATPTDLGRSLERILRTSCETLGVERAGVWILSADRKILRASCVWDRGALVDEPPATFDTRRHPAYFHELESQGIIAAGDARNDPRTCEFESIYHEPLGLAAMLDVAIRSHGTLVGVVCHEHRGGPREWSIEEQDFAASIADLVALVLEASKRRSLEEQLRNAQKMEAIGLLAGGIAHDFNNLLGIIVGYGELAAEALAGDHPAAAHVAKIRGASSRAADLVGKILTFSRGHGLPAGLVDFGQVLKDFAPLLTRTLGADVELSVSVTDEPMTVRADRTQLEQVLLNLSTNARQAMPSGGRLAIEASPVTLDTGAHLHLRVTDSGHGIDDATMTRLWEPFFTTRSEGTGLGLSMVYGIVQHYGGQIRADSRVGRGTTFHVYLPLDAGTAPEIAPKAPARAVRGAERLLVADDEALIRDLLIESLEGLGYEVLAAENGAEALALFERRGDEIDMVILDVVMPKLSGPDALRSMKSLKPDLKALFISGHAPESARLSDVLDTAGRAFLPKPFVLDDLAAKVREVLDARD